MSFADRAPAAWIGIFPTATTSVTFLAACVAVLWPIAIVISNHWTLTGLYEESVGIRYFYSLRSLYEPGAFLFLPQGQLINLYHKAIQIALTEAGFLPGSLWPRIDRFCYASIVGLQIINAACFAWMLVPIRTIAGKAVAGSICLLVLYSRCFSFFVTLLQPDYVALEPAVVFVTVGLMLRTIGGAAFSPSRQVAMTVIVGLTLSIKPTLGLLPATACAHALLSEKFNRAALVRGVVIAAGAAALWLLIWLADQNLNLRLFGKSLYYFAAFIYTRGGMAPNPMDWLSWVALRLKTSPALIAIAYAAPVLCALALIWTICTRQRSVALAFALLLATSVAEHIFLYERDYGITLMESASVVLIVVLLLAAQLDERLRYGSVLLRGGTMAACAIAIAVFLDDYPGNLVANAGRNTEEQQHLPSPSGPASQLWLITDNDWRPLSVHSAILKGGDAGRSPLVSELFPNLHFRFYRYNPAAIDLNRYEAIYFTYQRDDLNTSLRQVSSYYAVDLTGWTCTPLAPINSLMVARCNRATQSPG